MSQLEGAIGGRQWQRASLYLLLGVAQAAGRGANPGGRPGSRPAGGERPRTRKGSRRFYAEALSEAERLELEEALAVEGLDEEIALLRLKLRRALDEEPENLSLMVKGLELLVRAVSARYRVSRDDQEGLTQGLRAVLEELGAKLYPEGFGDG